MKQLRESLEDRAKQVSRERTKFSLRYGRVSFAARERFGLSTEEALLADVLSSLARKTGWSFASRSYIARILGVSTRSLRRMLAKLLEHELVEKHPTRNRLLRPTRKWAETYRDTRSDRTNKTE